VRDLVLGLSFFGHDSSASLVDLATGEILYALTEERFSNRKHEGRFPIACVTTILDIVRRDGIGTIRYVALNFAPALFSTQTLARYVERVAGGAAGAINAAVAEVVGSTAVVEPDKFPHTYLDAVMRRLSLPRETIDDVLARATWYLNWSSRYRTFVDFVRQRFPDCHVVEVPHHLCHAASAFHASGFPDAAILVMDGQGESETITLKRGDGNGITDLAATLWPHSIGHLYLEVTEFLGFAGLGDEYKVMGMAGHGQPVHVDLFHQIGDVGVDGTFRFIESDLMRFAEVPGCPGHFRMAMTEKLRSLLGGGKAKGETEFAQAHFDVAASLQLFVERMGVKLARALRGLVPDTANICIAGGVGLNGLMNTRILREAGFDRIFIQPAAADDGTSLGAALQVQRQFGGQPRQERMRNAFLGVSYADGDIRRELDACRLVYSTPPDIHATVANLLAEGNIVARYTGRSEFGPRALGNRSILANPLLPDMKDTLNIRVKRREPFRPFAPACLVEHVGEYFETEQGSEYMLLIVHVRPEKRNVIPAIVHADGTARLQAVTQDANPEFRSLIQAFLARTGVPVVLNTSFNTNGEAIVETPLDAIESFLFMDIDALAIGPHLVLKKDNVTRAINEAPDVFLSRRKNRYNKRFFGPEFFMHPFEFIGVPHT